MTDREQHAKRSSGAKAPVELSYADCQGTLGRYALFGEIASGGMATVHLARLIGSVGFARTVAIKRLHPHLAKDPDFVAMFLEEARLAARVHHPNVVSTLDVVQEDNELFLVMEYVAGESLSRLVRKTREAKGKIPPRFVLAMICQALEGLHAAHDATSERGAPLGLVHRDISPQNIHVGIDGVARVLDFGIAKATNRVQETRTDQIKGKVAYMSPEQLAKGPIDRRADVYSASVVLWEALTGARLFKADDVPSLVYAIMNDEIHPPSSLVPDLPLGLDAIVMKGLERDASRRWSSAREMAVALEKVLPPAAPRDIGEWVEKTGGEALAWRMELVKRIESETSASIPPGKLRAHAPKSPSSPIEVASGVAIVSPPATESDATTHELDLPNEKATAPSPLRPEISIEPSPMRPPEPSHPGDFGAVSEVMEAPSTGRLTRSAPIVLALFVLLAAGGILTYRYVEVEQSSTPTTPTTPAPSESTEQAINLSISRSASPSAKPKPSAVEPPPTTTPQRPIAAPTPPANDCENPFYVDAKGLRHPKPHCFKR